MEFAMSVRLVLTTVLAAAVAGCAGYNLQVGTSGYDVSEFQQVYAIPATSLRPWAERSRTVAPLPPPPPEDGSSGSSTLPAAPSALPPERPAPKSGG
jgi:hypothetical protein